MELSLVANIIDQSSALASVAKASESPGSYQLVGRAGEPVGALLAASLSRHLNRPILVLCAGMDECDRFRRDWATFLDCCEADQGVEDFPAWESLFEDASEPDPETYARRTAVVEAFESGAAVCIAAPVQAVLQPIARDSNSTTENQILLRPEIEYPMGTLAKELVEAGYRRFPQVARPGDFSIRGGIFDIFPREARHPYRLDYFADEIDTIHAMSLSDQRSQEEVNFLSLTLRTKDEYFIRGFTGSEKTLFDSLPPDALLVVNSPLEVQEKCEQLLSQWAPRKSSQLADELWARTGKLSRVDLEALSPEHGRKPIILPSASAEHFQGKLERVLQSIKTETERGTAMRIFFRQQAEIDRFQEILDESEISGAIELQFGELSKGFRWRDEQSGIFLSGAEILGRSRALTRRVRKARSGEAVQSFLEFEPGDYVVHVGHGIARYKGIRRLRQGRRQGDHLVLEFKEAVQVLVPAERIDLVQKYIGTGHAPRVDKVGGTSWTGRKKRVEDAVQDLAVEMLEVQAMRAERPGHAFPKDNHWQNEFDDAFEFEETRDQLEAIDAIRSDLEAAKPMDRLVCGDVGYGKTELAMRAAFKVVQGKKQVAVLVPTTVLAQQHLISFRERMAEFPVEIEALSRLRSRKEATAILERAREGTLDILIGTHRLLSQDVSFKDLGLIVVDEEQRFGVAHKERLKQLRRLVDILTLTATPIPRTLHMALIGVRDISSLQEAPTGRQSVHTEVCTFEEKRFREIILREMNRDGQVFYVHNRVTSIQHKTLDIQALVPEARVTFVHGQMDEHEIEERLSGFIHKQFDILVATTIIESGLDIPSANTLIVERADRFGLAELHQLRGRVGRGQHQAYAYFLLPTDRPINKDAKARLQAIEEFSSLGAGFQIAMRDLEIRGAGNILGKEQSGHIATVGYDLYCRLLDRAVSELRGSVYREPLDVDIALPGSSLLPDDYISNDSQRLRFYRAVSSTLDTEEVKEVQEDIHDRFGQLPEAANNLLRHQLLRIHLGGLGVHKAWLEEGWLLLAGSRNSILHSFKERGWTLRDLPDGSIGVRVKTSKAFREIKDVAAAVLTPTKR